MRSARLPLHSAFLREHWEKIRAKLEDGSYKPSPVRRVEIPKDGGGKRTLGIPTVLDRMIQQAIAQVLTPLYDPTFSDSSFGFRPMRSAHDAITVMAEEALLRYADDFVILCRSPRAGERILRSVRRYLADELKLIVNETKSRVVKLAEASFLGFKIVRCEVRWTEKSQKKFKAKVRKITKRTRGHSPKTVIEELQSYLRGAA